MKDGAPHRRMMSHAVHVGQATDDRAQVAIAIAPIGVATEQLAACGVPIIALDPIAARQVAELIMTAAAAADREGGRLGSSPDPEAE